jgi:tRNA dimethylallyltransferase
MESTHPKIQIVCGPTASGKSAYALELAAKLDGVIINCDSMQVYKEIPIITAQPTAEEQQQVEHRLYGGMPCKEHGSFSVGVWLKHAISEITEVEKLGRTPILVGGSGLYISALLNGIADIPQVPSNISNRLRAELAEQGPEAMHARLRQVDQLAATQIKPRDGQRILRALGVFAASGKPLSYFQQQPLQLWRPRINYHVKFIAPEREWLYARINSRFDQMLKNGVLDEITQLMQNHGVSDVPPAHGLRELMRAVSGEVEMAEAIEKSKQITRNYAKRQFTWFKHQIVADELVCLPKP